MQEWWWIPLAASGFFAVVLALNGLVTLVGGRWLNGLLRLVVAIGLGWACLGLALLGLNLQTYPMVKPGEPLAILSFQRIDEGVFDATLTRPGRDGMIDDVRTYRLNGDYWHLSARTLTWTALARPLGLESHARLEALTGLKVDSPLVDQRPSNAQSLNDGEPKVTVGRLTLPWRPTVWATTHRLRPPLDILRPRLVETAITPMRNEDSYELSLTQSGLRARRIATPGSSGE